MTRSLPLSLAALAGLLLGASGAVVSSRGGVAQHPAPPGAGAPPPRASDGAGARRPLHGKGHAEALAEAKLLRQHLAGDSSSGAAAAAVGAAHAEALAEARLLRQRGGAPAAAAAAAVAPAVSVRRAQSGYAGGAWPTEHADAANSGFTSYEGPGDVMGFCRNYVAQSDPLNPLSERFYATGVTSIADFKFWFGGGNLNVLRMIQVLGGADPSANYFQEWDLDLETIRPNPVNATPYGLISSGSVWASDIADNIALPSTDGFVYCLWWLSCIDSVNSQRKLANGTADFSAPRLPFAEAERRAQVVVQDGSSTGGPTVYAVDEKLKAALLDTPEARAALLRRAGEGAGVEEEAPTLKDPFPTCVQWSVGLGTNGNMPSLSPTRYVAPVPPNAMVPLVLVSESNPDIDTGGMLHALNANSGEQMWQFQAVDKQSPNPVWWGLTGVVPAVDSTRDNMVFLAYGAVVVALRGSDGFPLSYLDTSSIPEPENPSEFVYSSGYFDAGGDVFGPFQNMTYDNATALCIASALCKGFTFQNGRDFDFMDPYTIDPNAYVFFKSQVSFVATPPRFRWAAFKKPGFGIDPFVSSPVLSSKRDALFLHTAAGTLWRINIGGTSNAPTLTFAWACDYLVNPPANFSQCGYNLDEVARHVFPAPVFSGSDGAPGSPPAVVPGNPERGEVVHRGDYVAGGWPQPTTRAQRDELYVALRDKLLALAPAELAAARAAHPELAAVGAESHPSISQAAAIMAVFRAAGRAFELHSMRTRSGYVRLDGCGVPVDQAYLDLLRDANAEAAAPPLGAGGGGLWFSVYPFSSPAAASMSEYLSADVLVLPQYLPYARGTEGVFQVFQDDGTVEWSASQWLTDEGKTVSFGRSRSSPVIDGSAFAYVGADVPDPFFGNNSRFTLPTLFAFDMSNKGFLMWATGMGMTTNSRVDYASAIVTDGVQDAHTAFMASTRGLVYLNEGVGCPSDDPIFECSRYGSCNCSTGSCSCFDNVCIGGPKCAPLCMNGDCDDSQSAFNCACSPCWSGPSCAVAQTCGTNSGCEPSSGVCTCNACFVLDALGACTVPLCGDHGACSSNACTCADGWTGPTCNIAPSGAASAAAAAIDATTTIFVGVPLGLVAALVAYLLYFRAHNPLKPLHAALPVFVQERLGFKSLAYSTIETMPGTAPSKLVGGAGAGSSPTQASKAAAAASSKLLGAPGARSLPAVVKGNNEAAMARVGLLSAKSTGRGGAGGYGGV